MKRKKWFILIIILSLVGLLSLFVITDKKTTEIKQGGDYKEEEREISKKKDRPRQKIDLTNKENIPIEEIIFDSEISPKEMQRIMGSFQSIMKSTVLVVKGRIEENQYTVEEITTIEKGLINDLRTAKTESKVKIEKILWQKKNDQPAQVERVIQIRDGGGIVYNSEKKREVEVTINKNVVFKEGMEVVLFLRKQEYGPTPENYILSSYNRFIYIDDQHIQSEMPTFKSSKGFSVLTLKELKEELSKFKEDE